MNFSMCQGNIEFDLSIYFACLSSGSKLNLSDIKQTHFSGQIQFCTVNSRI